MGQPVYTWVTSSTQSLEADGHEATPLDCSNKDDVGKRGNFVSCPQVYTSAGHTAVLMSLVVNLDNGKLDGFAWDNVCTKCGPKRCMLPSTSFNLNGSFEGPEKFEVGVCGT